jgi:hypothetical protein
MIAQRQRQADKNQLHRADGALSLPNARRAALSKKNDWLGKTPRWCGARRLRPAAALAARRWLSPPRLRAAAGLALDLPSPVPRSVQRFRCAHAVAAPASLVASRTSTT